MLIPEHLRLGTWDLLKGWSEAGDDAIAPRLALQLVHEAAVCATGIRRGRSLGQKGFELANGLPFIATDTAIHELLGKHAVAKAQQLQSALGKLRRTHGDYAGDLLIIDPHHLRVTRNDKRANINIRTIRKRSKRSKPIFVWMPTPGNP